MTTRKLTGVRLFRHVAGQAIARNIHCSFAPDELFDILYEIDKAIPRTNKAIVPSYVKREKLSYEKAKTTTENNKQ